MLIPCKINVITTANDIRQLYAIYLHKDADGTVQYIGVAPLREMFTLLDATANSMWSDIFGKPVTTLEIDVVALTPSEKEAYSEQRRLIGIHKPVCNQKGFIIDPRRQRVVCNETNEVFENAAEAARIKGVSHSQLVNHLNRKIGHKTVKGYTYSRTSRDD